ncbi:Tol-Pal system beta propeller repeat protein TolB [Sphingomonas sp. G124]|uniref:Tol-Pal system protein TolB n=1 Tax=Sphingomonas cremea TaxID=2904799 RepID=A0A9X1QM87_9SPHN|nr:Tol-Pal system beta propeller repeat protein TolB [Sphingomonas cremea]MCF2515271.1 Tol-Pal system beta propeller repeat protein TolB [Sphingomonas cremea]
MKQIIAAVFLLPIAAAGFAQDTGPLEVDVVGGIQAPMAVAVPAMPSSSGDTAVGRQIAEVISSDLRSTGLFTPLGPSGIDSYSYAQASNPVYATWRNAGAAALVSGYVETGAGGRITLACYLFDVSAGRELARQGFAVNANDWRRAAHKCADLVYSRLSGEQPFLDTRVVYVAETGPKNARVKRIAIMDSDGSNHRYLTPGKATVLTPRFSPRGDKLVYMSYQGRRPRVYVMDVVTGTERLLVPGTAFTFAPRFSPDGSQIVFSMASGGNTDIYVVGANGGQPRRLTSTPGADTSPSFSPDGNRIVFESDRSGSQQLYVMNYDGSQQKRISFGGGAYASPVWSPRGELIAFTRIGGGAFRIGVMSPGGGGERLLTNAWQDEGPSWAPNGQFVMFYRTAQGSGNATLYAVSINGGQPRRMPTPVGGSDPSWSPLNN